MLHGVFREKLRKTNDDLLFTHSERIGLFDDSAQEVEHKDGILAAALVLVHRKPDVLQPFVKVYCHFLYSL